MNPPRLPQPSNGVELKACVDTFQKWLHLPDVGSLEFTLGVVAGNLLNGDPLWGLVVGAPGCGKTEVVGATVGLPYVHPVATLSPAALLSGTSKKDRSDGATGGLLRSIGDFGVVVLKDFGSVLSQRYDARSEALSALREVYDGSYNRAMGSDGGRVLAWRGKCGVLGACTPSIDRHHAVMATLGERFVLYRTAVDNPSEQARRRLRNIGNETQMRLELAETVAAVLDTIEPASPLPLSDDDTDDLIAIARFAVIARTGVERDGYDHEVLVMPTAEAPARLAGALSTLYAGMTAVGIDDDEKWRIVRKVGWDSVPDVRQRVLRQLHEDGGFVTTSMLVATTGIPKTSTMRTLEDLHMLALVDQQKSGESETSAWKWSLSEEGHDLWPS